MASLKFNGRLEHVTRRGERRKAPRRKKKEVQPRSWVDRLSPGASVEEAYAAQAADKLTADIEKDLFNPEGPKLLGLQEQVAPAPATLETATDFEISKLKNMVRSQALTIKRLQLALALSKADVLERELKALEKEMSS